MTDQDFSWLKNPPPHIRDFMGRNTANPSASRQEANERENILQAIENGTIDLVLEFPRAEQSDIKYINFLDAHDCRVDIYTGDPAPRDWLIKGMMLNGKSVLLAGLGGVSKTQLALQLAISVALGERFVGRETQSGNVLMLLGEEDSPEVSRRVSAIVRKCKLSDDKINIIKNRLRAYPLVGVDMRLTIKNGKTITETKCADAIIAKVNQMGGVKLIVLDHMALLHGGDFNALEDAAQTVRILNRITVETSAAVLVLAHSPKAAIGSSSSDASHVSGSGGFVNLTRGTWILAKMRDEEAKKYGISTQDSSRFVSLTGAKGNYSPDGQVFWFERQSFDEIGLLDFVELVAPTPEIKQKKEEMLATRIVEFVGARPGQYSKTGLRNKCGGLDGPLKASKESIDAMIEELLSSRRLINRAPIIDEVKKFGHTGRTRGVLDVPQLRRM